MEISTILYDFNKRKVILVKPSEVIKETEKCYFTEKRRILKSDIGVTRLLSTTMYPYLELMMVDADEGKLREVMAKWFTDMAFDIWKMWEE